MSAQRLRQRTVLRQQGRFLLVQRAQTLALDAPSFRDLLRRIEGDELFRRLADAGAPAGALVRRKAFARMRPRPTTDSADREAAHPGTSFDLGGALSEHAEGIDALRRLGLERARALLETESPREQRRRLGGWGLDEEETALVLALLEHLSVFGAMAALDPGLLPPGPPSTPVARLEPGPEGSFVVVPLVSYFRCERYDIDYDRIAQARREGLFSDADVRRLPALLGEIESINYRGDTLRRVLCGVADAHARWLRSRRSEDAAPLTQLALSQELGLHPSAVCRAVAGRSLLTPWGEELPVAAFFPGRKSRNQHAVASILRTEPRLSDREVALRVGERFGFRISRRMAAIYRRGLDIPNSYRRAAEAHPS